MQNEKGFEEHVTHKLSYQKRYVSVRKNKEFQFLFKRGECVVTYAFVCYYRPSRRRVNACGIVTSKKIGNAVDRNRARRIIREAFRQIEPVFREKSDKRYDFVFVARGKTPKLKAGQLLSLMKKQLLPRL